jgi:hypothetical protein
MARTRGKATMKVFVPMADEWNDAPVLAGERLVPYRCGVALAAMFRPDARRGDPVGQESKLNLPEVAAGPADRLP